MNARRTYAGHMRASEIPIVWLADGAPDVVRDSAEVLQDGEPALLLEGPLLQFFESVPVGERPGSVGCSCLWAGRARCRHSRVTAGLAGT